MSSRHKEVAGAGLPGCGSPTDLATLLRRDTAPRRLAIPTFVVMLLIVGIGGLLGFAAYRITNVGQSWPVSVTRTATGWRVSSKAGLPQSAPTLTEDYLAWVNGKCLELLDLHSGATRLLEPPPSDGSDGLPAVLSGRYAAWIATEGSNGSQNAIHAYDLLRRRPIVVPHIGNLDGAIALGHDTLYWQSHNDDTPNVGLIRARDLASGRSYVLAAGYVQLLDASGDLVEWTKGSSASDRNPLVVVKDVATGRSWRMRPGPAKDGVDGPHLSGRTLVWELFPGLGSSSPPFRKIEALDLDSGVRRVVAQGMGSQVGVFAAGDGRILWTRGSQYLVENASGGAAQPLNLAWPLTDDIPVISATMIARELGQTKGGGAAQIEVARTER